MKRAIAMILAAVVAVMMSGCALDQGAQTLMQENTKRVEASVQHREAITLAVLEYFKTTERGGMSLKLDENGKVQEIKYTQELPLDKIMQLVNTPMYQPEPVRSMVDEAGDFFSKAGSTIVSALGIYYGFEGLKTQQEYNYLNNKLNTEADVSMWNTYTDNYKNTEIGEPYIVEPLVIGAGQ